MSSRRVHDRAAAEPGGRSAAASSRHCAFRLRLRALSGYAAIGLALVVVGIGYSAVAAPESAAQGSGGSTQSPTARAGEALFSVGCSTCHGLNLQGGSGGPSLIGVGASAVVFQVESGRMPLNAGVQQAPRKAPRYTPDEIDQLAAYIQEIGGGPTVPSGDLTDGDLQLGGELFRTNCASCHNFAGSGGALSYGKYAPELKPASPRVVYTAMQSGPESMPRYADSQITPAEKRAITRYVSYITSSQNQGGASLGRLGPISEGLVIWLVGLTSIVGLTLWIGARA